MTRRTNGNDSAGPDSVSTTKLTTTMTGLTAMPTGEGSCQVCGTSVTEGAQLIRCSECDTPYHVDCWRYNNEICAIFGCRKGNARPEVTRQKPHHLTGKMHVVPPGRALRPADLSGVGSALAKFVGVLILIATMLPAAGPRGKRYKPVDSEGWGHEEVTHMLQWGDGPPRVRACELLGTMPYWGDNDWYWVQNAAQSSGYVEVRMAALRTLAAQKYRPDVGVSILRGATNDSDARVSQLAHQLLADR